jgi:hypothetical protein
VRDALVGDLLSPQAQLAASRFSPPQHSRHHSFCKQGKMV